MSSVHDKGFKSESELMKMVSDLDLSNNEIFKKFNDWKTNDGTKDGLLKLTN